MINENESATVDIEGAEPQKSNDSASDKSICITRIQTALENALTAGVRSEAEGGEGQAQGE